MYVAPDKSASGRVWEEQPLSQILLQSSDGQRHLVAQYGAGGDAVTLDRCGSFHYRISNNILILLFRTSLKSSLTTIGATGNVL